MTLIEQEVISRIQKMSHDERKDFFKYYETKEGVFIDDTLDLLHYDNTLTIKYLDEFEKDNNLAEGDFIIIDNTVYYVLVIDANNTWCINEKREIINIGKKPKSKYYKKTNINFYNNKNFNHLLQEIFIHFAYGDD
jgi:hypothetical protein